MLKHLIRQILKDPDFLGELFSAQIFTLDKNKAYFLVVEFALDEEGLASIKKHIPEGYNVALIHGATASLIELTNKLDS